MTDPDKKVKRKVKIDWSTIILLSFLLIVVYVSYMVGFSDGKITLCKDQGLVMVHFRGIDQCWTKFQYDNYVQQFNYSIREGFLLDGI